MKTYAAFAIALLLVSLNPAARADDESDRAALRAIKARYEEAANSGDLSKIANDVSKDFTGVMVTGESVAGVNGFADYWKKVQSIIGAGGSYHVVGNVEKTDIFGDVAVTRGTTDEKVRLGSGKELAFSGHWTAVCHREDGVWKIFRVEETLDPVDNVFVSALVKKTQLIYGAAGFVAGVIVMLLLRLLSRKRA